MKDKMNGIFTKMTTTLCTKMAQSVSASACNWSSYQPEEPKSLKSKDKIK